MTGLIMRLYKAFNHSWKGLRYAWQSQWAFRFELVLLIVAIPFAFYIGNSATQHVLMISSVVILPMTELLNSSIETTIDRIGFEHHELSGLAKDMASAAMVVAGINVLIIWGIIIFERFF